MKDLQQHQDKLERQTERQQQELTQAEQTIMTLSSSKVLIQCMYSCELSPSDAWHFLNAGVEVPCFSIQHPQTLLTSHGFAMLTLCCCYGNLSCKLLYWT